MKECLELNKFEDIEVKEVILRDWYLNKKIARPNNKLISHTGVYQGLGWPSPDDQNFGVVAYPKSWYLYFEWYCHLIFSRSKF